MEHVYASVDIGTSTIKLVVCELYKYHLNLLAATTVPALGLKKGLITDPELARNSIKKAFDDAEQMLGIRIRKVIVNISCYQADYKIIKSVTDVKGDLISSGDINTLFKNGVMDNMVSNREFVTLFPIDFIINEKQSMLDPKGFPGTTLAFRGSMVTTPKKNVYSVASVIESLGIDIVDISTGGIGDYHCFKTDTSNGIGVIVNMGDETTIVSLFNKGVPLNNRIIGVGGKNIDSDISYMYKINLEDAKTIKEKFALAHKKNCNSNEYYEISNIDGEKVKISQFEVTDIVMSRVEEILSLVKNEINYLTNKPIQYIIFTGGGSNLTDFNLLATEMLGSTCRIGKIKLIGVRNNKYSTALGNIIYLIDNLKLKGQNYSMLDNDDMEVLSSPDRHFINTSNESMLGKVFGYFFGE